MAVPVIESWNSANSGGTSQASITINKPTGVASGDLLVIIVGNNGANTTPNWDALTGWTQFVNDGSASDDTKIAAYWRIADGTEGASETVTTSDTSARRTYGWYFRISGADGTTPIDVSGSNNGQGGTSQSITAVTTTVADTLVFAMCAFDGGDAGATTFSWTGWTSGVDFESTVNSGTGAADAQGSVLSKSQASAGSTGDLGITYTVADGGSGMQFAIAPSAGTNVAASTDALTLTEHAATVNASTNVQAAADALTLATHAATVSLVAAGTAPKFAGLISNVGRMMNG